MRRKALPVVVAVVVAVATPAVAGSGEPVAVAYRPPVDAPVTDPFRPPPEPWAPGNRGIEYATAPGTPVGAAADGEVVFAGAVAGGLHVVVLHPDGVRTSYSFLQSIAVHRGDRVHQGQTVGTAGERLHFGARVGDVYIDPAELFDRGPPEVFLVPDEVRRPASESAERSGLLAQLRGLGGEVLAGGAHGLDWMRDRAADGVGAAHDIAAAQAAARLRQVRVAVEALRAADPGRRAARVAGTAMVWWRQRASCSPASQPPPADPGRGHVAVLVGGLASSSTGSPIDRVDTGGLGYAPEHVVRFSYRGGTTAEQPYGAPDTTVDIRRSARRLRILMERLARRHPGMPVDVLAHSQGGVVARAALAFEADPGSSRLPPLNALVTLASPHQGADLATALALTGGTGAGYGLQTAAHAAKPADADLRGASVRQLAETSDFMARLNERALPVGLRVTSIGGRGDLIVPAGRTRLAGAHHVILSPPGVTTQHSTLPGSSAGRREIALALAGRPPTCQTLADMVADAAVSEGISWAEDTAGAAAALGAMPTGSIPPKSDDPEGDNPP